MWVRRAHACCSYDAACVRCAIICRLWWQLALFCRETVYACTVAAQVAFPGCEQASVIQHAPSWAMAGCVVSFDVKGEQPGRVGAAACLP